MKNLILSLIIIITSCIYANADQFVPEFDKMQILKCDVKETIYDSSNNPIVTTGYYRIFRLDDENKKLYLQKEPVNVSYYGDDKLIFRIESMTDDFISTCDTEIDRNSNQYKSDVIMNYNNSIYGTKYGKATGNCYMKNLP